jgi:hypothetical protein
MSLDPSSPTPHEPPESTSLLPSSADSSSRKQSNDEKDGKFQIFLGGSCNPTTWRQSVAIPYLELNGITYYNPQIDNWTPELVKIERHAKQSAQVLFFVFDEQTRSTVSLVESAFMAGEGKKLVLVIYPFEYDVLSLTDTMKQTTSNRVETRSELTKTTSRKSSSPNRGNFSSTSLLQSSSTSSSKTISSTIKHASGTIMINGEIISIAEFQELQQARFILQTLVDKRNTAMFSDIPQALEYVTKCLAVDKSTMDDQSCANSTSAREDQKFELLANESDNKPIDSVSTKRDVNDDRPSDVCLMLDDCNDNNIESSLILMLRERGLSYNYRPLRDIINHEHLHGNKSYLTKDHTLSLTNDQQEVGKLSGSLDTSETECAGLSLKKEIDAIQSSRVLLFVITNKCRGLSIMVLASYFMALFRKNIVLCIQYLEDPCSINGEVLSKNAIADYNRGRVYLCDYAVKSQVPVFKTIREAVDCCSQRCGVRDIKD